MSKQKPVTTPEFWRERMHECLATGKELHHIVYNIDPARWQWIQEATGAILASHVRPGQRLLDAACGYGAIYEVIPAEIHYTGIDSSVDLLAIARIRYPAVDWRLGDISSMPELSGRYFDWAVCRSVKDMILENMGPCYWAAIEQELLRVARNVLVIEYEAVESYRILGDPVCPSV